MVLAPPTAELRPITAEYTQTDEEDMGMSYAELGDFGRLRKIERCVRAVWLCPPVLCTPLSCRLENAVQLGAGTNPSLLFSARILRITSHLCIPLEDSKGCDRLCAHGRGRCRCSSNCYPCGARQPLTGGGD
eukprot:SAG25_NODE_1448_length_2998_cov_1.666782_3_plen_132_part_00